MKYTSLTSNIGKPSNEAREPIQKMTQSTLLKWDINNSAKKGTKNANQSMEIHEVYNNYYTKLDLSNQKDKLFKQNVDLKRQIRKLEDQIIDSKFKANLWQTIKQNIMRHPISQGMITKKHGGCDSSFLKQFLQIIYQQPDNSKKSMASGCSTFATEYMIQRVSSTKTLNTQPKHVNFEKLQSELQQKSRRLITVEYELNLLKQHNVFLEGNGRLDKNLRLDKIKRLVEQKTQKMKILEQKQLKLQQIVRILRRQYQNILTKCQQNQSRLRSSELEKQRLIAQLKQRNPVQFQGPYSSTRVKIQNIQRLIQNNQSKQSKQSQSSNVQILKMRQMDQQQIKRLKQRCNQLNKQLNKLVRTMNKFRVNLSQTKSLNLSNLERLSENLEGQIQSIEDLSCSRTSQMFFYTPTR